MNRRTFLVTIAAASATAALPAVLSQPPAPKHVDIRKEIAAYNSIKCMSGVSDAPIEEQYFMVGRDHDRIPLHTFPEFSLPFSEWKRVIGKTILKNASIEYRVERNASYSFLTRMYDVGKWNVSPTSGRNKANRIIASSDIFSWISPQEKKLTEHSTAGYWRFPYFDRYGVVEFEPGEISKEPFLLIGYSGLYKYDSSTILAIRERLPNAIGAIGSFHHREVGAYWYRII